MNNKPGLYIVNVILVKGTDITTFTWGRVYASEAEARGAVITLGMEQYPGTRVEYVASDRVADDLILEALQHVSVPESKELG